MKRSLVLFLLLCLIPVNLPSFAAAGAPAHPRYIYSAADVGRVRALSDSYASTIINNFINSANSVLSSSPVPQSFVGIRMDCTQGGRALELAYAYLLTGNADYAGGALQEAEYACSYPSWNHRDHFLDTSSMATCVAAVYDWCYDTLTNENKTYLESKIRAYFTEPALEVYNGTADFPSSQWHVNTKNWNTVCDGDDILYEFEDGKWYHFSMLFDPLKHLIYIDINGERAVDGKYSEKLSGTMRPLYMITGISDPYSVMMIDNYRIEELDTIPDISVSASAANGYIQAGTSQITVRTAAAITKNDITVVKNGEVQSFDIMAGENGVYNITLSDAAHIGDRYTLKLENAAFCSVKRFRFISDGLAAVTACGTRKEGDTLYLSIKTLNKTGSPQRMNIVTAFYKNGKMQDAAINTVFALNGEMTSEFSLKTGVSADNFKIFLASPESLERLD